MAQIVQRPELRHRKLRMQFPEQLYFSGRQTCEIVGNRNPYIRMLEDYMENMKVQLSIVLISSGMCLITANNNTRIEHSDGCSVLLL